MQNREDEWANSKTGSTCKFVNTNNSMQIWEAGGKYTLIEKTVHKFMRATYNRQHRVSWIKSLLSNLPHMVGRKRTFICSRDYACIFVRGTVIAPWSESWKPIPTAGKPENFPFSRPFSFMQLQISGSSFRELKKKSGFSFFRSERALLFPPNIPQLSEDGLF